MRTRHLRIPFYALFLAVCLCHSAIYALDDEKPVLHVYTWLDYFDSNVINEFQIKHNCVVSLDYYDSNDLMLKALELDSGGFDVMTPSSVVSAVMHRRGMTLNMDHSKLPNIRHIDRSSHALVADPEMHFSIPYTATVTGIGYNKTKVREADLGSWDIFANPAYAGRSALLDEPREVLGAALKFLGHPINSTDNGELRSAGARAGEWLGTAALADINSIRDGLLNGSYVVAQGYNGDMAYVIGENPDIGFFVPREGAALAADVFVIPADSPLPDLAHAFINHMLEPDVAKTNMQSIFYYMPNTTALSLVQPHLLRNPAFNVKKLVNARCEKLIDSESDGGAYDAVWDGVLKGSN